MGGSVGRERDRPGALAWRGGPGGGVGEDVGAVDRGGGGAGGPEEARGGMNDAVAEGVDAERAAGVDGVDGGIEGGLSGDGFVLGGLVGKREGEGGLGRAPF